jgi:putative ABC transport system substrate-binding protein
MEEFGYREGVNVHYDIRFLNTKEEIAAAVKDFIAQGVDLIHTYSTPATQEAWRATKDLPQPLPIVFGSMGDPVIAGVVKEIQRPGTNVTGVASLSTELTARRLDLLLKIRPGIRRVAMPHSAPQLGDAASARSIQIAKEAAQKLGVELVFYVVNSAADNAVVARQILRKDVDGMIISADSLIFAGLTSYVEQSLKEKIPFAVFDISQVEQGGLVGFGPDYTTSGGQSALLANQILHGKKPEEIAVQIPQKLLLMVNLKTARAIGVDLDAEFLKQVDLVINASP